MNYYRRYVGDYMRGTAELSLMEHGAYCLLIDTCFATERPLPVDKKSIYRILRAMTRDEQQAIDAVLAKYFELRPDGWHQEWIDSEVTSAQAVIEMQRESGTRTAAKRWGEPDRSIDRSTNRSIDWTTERSAVQPPSTNHHPPTANRQPPSKSGARGARLTLESMPAEWSEFAKGERPDLDPARVWPLFRDHWIAQAGSKGVKLDWFATWRNWVRKEKRTNGGGNGNSNGKFNVHAANRAAINRAVADEATAEQRNERVVGESSLNDPWRALPPPIEREPRT